jgi:hypothetical protein
MDENVCHRFRRILFLQKVEKISNKTGVTYFCVCIVRGWLRLNKIAICNPPQLTSHIFRIEIIDHSRERRPQLYLNFGYRTRHPAGVRTGRRSTGGNLLDKLHIIIRRIGFVADVPPQFVADRFAGTFRFAVAYVDDVLHDLSERDLQLGERRRRLWLRRLAIVYGQSHRAQVSVGHTGIVHQLPLYEDAESSLIRFPGVDLLLYDSRRARSRIAISRKSGRPPLP